MERLKYQFEELSNSLDSSHLKSCKQQEVEIFLAAFGIWGAFMVPIRKVHWKNMKGGVPNPIVIDDIQEIYKRYTILFSENKLTNN